MNPSTWSRICNLCGGLRAYLPRTDWRDTGDDPRNVVPVRLELCQARALGALLCPTCDLSSAPAGGPPRWPQAIMVP